MKQPVERRLAAILAADVAGYSRLMGADEEGTHERLRRSSPASWKRCAALPRFSGGWPSAMQKRPRISA